MGVHNGVEEGVCSIRTSISQKIRDLALELFHRGSHKGSLDKKCSQKVNKQMFRDSVPDPLRPHPGELQALYCGSAQAFRHDRTCRGAGSSMRAAWHF